MIPTVDQLLVGVVTLVGLFGMAAAVYMAFDALLRPRHPRARGPLATGDLPGRADRRWTWPAGSPPKGDLGADSAERGHAYLMAHLLLARGWLPSEVARLLQLRARRDELRRSEYRQETP